MDKESLATILACEKFSTCILGQPFLVEFDQKPLVRLFNMKHLDALPSLVLKFWLRLTKYDYVIIIFQENSCTQLGGRRWKIFLEEMEAYVDHVTVPSIPVAPQRFQVYSWLKLKILSARRLEGTVNSMARAALNEKFVEAILEGKRITYTLWWPTTLQ